MPDFVWMIYPDIAAITMIAAIVVQQQRFYECGVVLNPAKTIHDYYMYYYAHIIRERK